MAENINPKILCDKCIWKNAATVESNTILCSFRKCVFIKSATEIDHLGNMHTEYTDSMTGRRATVVVKMRKKIP